MLIISDTSPITTLLQIARSDLLPQLFDKVLIPNAVKDELLRFHRTLPNFLEVQEVKNTLSVEELDRELDHGEAEAIVLAEELNTDFLLMDEKHGRSIAEARGIKVVGLLGVLLMAKKAGLVDSLTRIIDQIESQAGFFVSDSVKRIILVAAGEIQQ